ncbi:OapB/ArvB family protein [Candidatus Pyrohabitans sp.]
MEIQLDFVSAETLARKGGAEKISFILDKIKRNVILVLEEALEPKEEAELIEATMREIDPDEFHGIEFYRIDHGAKGIREKIAEYISGRRHGITIVGPTRLIEAIKREPDYISMLAKADINQEEKKEGRKRPTSARGAGKSTRKTTKGS